MSKKTSKIAPSSSTPFGSVSPSNKIVLNLNSSDTSDDGDYFGKKLDINPTAKSSIENLPKFSDMDPFKAWQIGYKMAEDALKNKTQK